MPPLSPLVCLLALSAPPEHTTRISPRTLEPPPTAVLGADRLGEDAAADLPAILAGEPGLTTPRLGGLGAYATLSIRGSTPEQVLVALDGVPLNPADGAPVDLSTLPVGPLSHLAIHRGRSPWSLGQVGLGGALRLETQRPKAPTAQAELGLGSFSTRLVRAFAAARPYLVAVDYLGTASDFRFVNDQGTAWDPNDDVVTTRQNAASDQVNALARVTLGDDALRFTALNVLTHAERGLPSLGVTPTRDAALTFTRNLTALRLDATPGPLLLAATTWLAFADTTVHDPRAEIGLGAGDSTRASLVPGAVVTAHLPLPDHHLVPTLHLAWRHESSEGRSPTTDASAPSRHVLSAAAELLYRRPTFELAGGLRAEATSTSPTALAAFAESALTLDALRLTLGLSHAPRLPSIFERFGDLGLVLGNPDLRPETATTLELGARYAVPLETQRLELAAFAFATAASDLIQFVQNAQGVARPENLASARVLGLELAAEADLFDHLRVRSTLTLLDATDTSDIAARRGKQLPLRPGLSTAHRVELYAADAALGPDGAYGLALELEHVADNVADYANLVHIPARTLLGASLFLRDADLELRLTASNVLESRVQDLAGYPLPGFTTHLALRLTP